MSSRIKSAVLASLFGTLTVAACAGSETPNPIDLDDAASPDGAATDDGGTVLPDSGTDTDGDSPLPDAGGSVCGNNVEEAGEQCDDGNLVDGDGCSATCQLESGVEGDVCPGQVLPLNESIGAVLRGSVSGSTVSAFNHYGSACGGGSGKDVVYSITSPTSGKATVTLDADYLAILSARGDCTDAVSELGCMARDTNATGPVTLELPVFANTPAFVMIDGYAGSEGNFTLTAEVSTASCGNGIAELPERCDDGNLVDGDGCSASCELEAGGVLGQCPGQPFRLTGAPGAPRSVSFAGNTATDGADPGFSHDATHCFFGDGNNVVYAIQSDVDGSAHAELLAGYRQSALHVRNECASSSFQQNCVARSEPGTTSLDFPVKAGEWFYLFVDSRTVGGPFTASLTVTPSVCGNGRLDGDEACDDGNLLDNDGCDASCALEPLDDADTCAGQVVALGAPGADGIRRGRITSTTVGRTNKVPGCRSAHGAALSVGDAIFAVDVPIDGRLTASVSSSFQTQVGVLSDTPCLQPANNSSRRLPNVLACSFQTYTPDNWSAAEPYIISGMSSPRAATAAVAGSRRYYVVVDTFHSASPASASGSFVLDLAVAPATCGNGLREGTEACDDGNLVAGDGCSPTCDVEDPSFRNTCDTAEEMVLTQSAPDTFSKKVQASTANLERVQNFGTACPALGPDAYFKFTTPAAGVLRVTAKSSAFDVVLGLRRADFCETTTAPLACADGGPRGSEESLARVVAPGETFYAVVDSPWYPEVSGCVPKPGNPPFGEPFVPYDDCEELLERGLFEIDVSVSPSACGDGFFVPSATEKCDDGNLIDGDGCSSTCQIEPKPDANVCPGHLLTLSGNNTAGYRGVLTLDTATLTANFSGVCGGSARDGVVRVVAPANGTLRAQARGMTGATVYARAICNDPNSEFRKVSSTLTTCPNVVHDTVSLQAVAGQEYFLFVDGLEGATGTPTLHVTLEP